MTDGKSNPGVGMGDLRRAMTDLRLNYDIPVFSILFGDADPQQLDEIAKHTSGRVFDGRKDLVQAFREAKGYN